MVGEDAQEENRAVLYKVSILCKRRSRNGAGKSQVMLPVKVEHFLTKKCPDCPMQKTTFFVLSTLSPFPVMKKRKGEDSKKKNVKEEKGKGKQLRNR